ncbi:MAG: hypothetical protein M1831_004873 [Alyxoria varia]|nr:MAG: hypothetical protein M1831_004873 [Alyxoria varia]
MDNLNNMMPAPPSGGRAPLMDLPVELQEIIMEYLDESYTRTRSRKRNFEAKISPDLLNYRRACKWLSVVSRNVIRRRIMKYNPGKMEYTRFHFKEEEVWQLAARAEPRFWSDFTYLDIYFPSNNTKATMNNGETPGIMSEPAVRAMQRALSRLHIKTFSITDARIEHCDDHDSEERFDCEHVEDMSLHNKYWDFVASMPQEFWESLDQVHAEARLLNALTMSISKHRRWLRQIRGLQVLRVNQYSVTSTFVVLGEAKSLETIDVGMWNNHICSIELFQNQEWPRLKKLELSGITIRFEDLIRITSPESFCRLCLFDVDLREGVWENYLQWLRAKWLPAHPSALWRSHIEFSPQFHDSKEWRDLHSLPSQDSLIELCLPPSGRAYYRARKYIDLLRGMGNQLLLARRLGNKEIPGLFEVDESDLISDWGPSPPDTPTYSSDNSDPYGVRAEFDRRDEERNRQAANDSTSSNSSSSPDGDNETHSESTPEKSHMGSEDSSKSSGSSFSGFSPGASSDDACLGSSKSSSEDSESSD